MAWSIFAIMLLMLFENLTASTEFAVPAAAFGMLTAGQISFPPEHCPFDWQKLKKFRITGLMTPAGWPLTHPKIVLLLLLGSQALPPPVDDPAIAARALLKSCTDGTTFSDVIAPPSRCPS